jgi:hypothetical protein
MVKIRPYKMGSRSAKLLRECLQEKLGKRVLLVKNEWAMKKATIINWGNRAEFPRIRGTLGNMPESVRYCVDKINSFRVLDGLTPEYTYDRATATRWVEEGSVVYCRTLTTSREGRGIVLAARPEQIVSSPLYTKRFPHAREYRVHIINGSVVQVVQKRKRTGADNADPRIRSNRDWVFARALTGSSEEVERVKAVALEGARRLGINFGAFDVLYSVKQEKAVILECNSAPGLDRTSAMLYAEALKRKLDALRRV